MFKRVILGVVIASIAVPAFAQVRVNGYFRKDGTYVAPHMRTAPDNSRSNNWTSQGNVNPYTGQQGTTNPYAPPPPSTTYGNTYTYTPPCYYNCGN